MSNEIPDEWRSSPQIAPILEFRKSMIDLQRHMLSLAESGEKQDLIDALVVLHAIKGDIGDIFAMYQQSILDLIPNSETLTATNGQNVEKRAGSDRKKWQHKQLATEVARKLTEMSVDMDTGEFTGSPKQIAEQMLDYLQPSYWRVKQLSTLGINADQFCDVEEPKENIIISRMETK